MKFSKEIAKISLETGAIRLEAETPFLWASGYRMPIYNDNRLLLGNAKHRRLIAEGFKDVITSKEIEVDVIAGTATAGIPPATSLANLLETPLIYVRTHPKEHGMKNQIEGVLRQNQNVIVVEDLISTGGSALNGVTAIREAGGKVDHCLSIFSYGFSKAIEQFKNASWPYSGSIVIFEQCKINNISAYHKINNWCYLGSYSTYEKVVKHAANHPKYQLNIDEMKIIQSFLNHHPEQCINL